MQEVRRRVLSGLAEGDDSQPMTANQITADLLIEIPKRFDATVWRNNRIDAMAIGRGGNLRRVSAGINGQGDITGIATINVMTPAGALPAGLRVEIEVKAGKDRIRPSQMAFSFMITSRGGMYIVAHDVDGALQEFEEFLCRYR